MPKYVAKFVENMLQSLYPCNFCIQYPSKALFSALKFSTSKMWSKNGANYGRNYLANFTPLQLLQIVPKNKLFSSREASLAKYVANTVAL